MVNMYQGLALFHTAYAVVGLGLAGLAIAAAYPTDARESRGLPNYRNWGSE